MSLLFACDDVPPEPWIEALRAELPGLEIHVWPRAAAPVIADTLRRLAKGRKPLNVVDTERGY